MSARMAVVKARAVHIIKFILRVMILDRMRISMRMIIWVLMAIGVVQVTKIYWTAM